MTEYLHGGHSKCDIKYHVVWITKYRYKVITPERTSDSGLRMSRHSSSEGAYRRRSRTFVVVMSTEFIACKDSSVFGGTYTNLILEFIRI